MWVGFIQSCKGLGRTQDWLSSSRREFSCLPAFKLRHELCLFYAGLWTWTGTSALPILAHQPHNQVSQFLIFYIKIHTHTYIYVYIFYWFCFLKKSWLKHSWVLVFVFFFFLLHCAVCGLLVPQPGIKPMPPAVEAQFPNHWTSREVPRYFFFTFKRKKILGFPGGSVVKNLNYQSRRHRFDSQSRKIPRVSEHLSPDATLQPGLESLGAATTEAHVS